jgi:hypothetical protein
MLHSRLSNLTINESDARCLGSTEMLGRHVFERAIGKLREMSSLPVDMTTTAEAAKRIEILDQAWRQSCNEYERMKMHGASARRTEEKRPSFSSGAWSAER